MNPFFFGDSKQPLYGVYHPSTGSPKSEGVVLCCPFGQESMRAHRAVRQLALRLAKAGYHVLRFDYRGTGDSALDMTDVDAQCWVDDVSSAVDELREMSSVSKISVVGLRLGALFAAAACINRDDINHLIVWDPILSGADYLNELRAEISSGDTASYNYIDNNGCLNFNGFAIPAAFQASLEALSLLDMKIASIKSVCQIVSHETNAFDTLRQVWSKENGFQYQLAPAPHDWNFVDEFGGILLPQPIIQAIVDWLP